MKKLKCDLCDEVASGESFEDWMIALMPHYMEKHSDMMSDPNQTEKDKENWMKENKKRFEDAKTLEQ